MTGDTSPTDLEAMLRRVIREEIGPHAGGARRQVAGRPSRPASRQPGASGEGVADRDVLPQGRDASEPLAHPGAAGQRLGPAAGGEGAPPGLRHRLLRNPDELQRPLRRGAATAFRARRASRRSLPGLFAGELADAAEGVPVGDVQVAFRVPGRPVGCDELAVLPVRRRHGVLARAAPGSGCRRAAPAPRSARRTP